MKKAKKMTLRQEKKRLENTAIWGPGGATHFFCKADLDKEENGDREQGYFTFSERSNKMRCTTQNFYRTRDLLGKGGRRALGGGEQCKANIGEQHNHRPLSVGERDYALFRQKTRIMITEQTEQMTNADILARMDDLKTGFNSIISLTDTRLLYKSMVGVLTYCNNSKIANKNKKRLEIGMDESITIPQTTTPIAAKRIKRKRPVLYDSSSSSDLSSSALYESSSSSSDSSEGSIVGHELMASHFNQEEPTFEVVRMVKGRPSEIEEEAQSVTKFNDPSGGEVWVANYPSWLSQRRGANCALYKLPAPLHNDND